MAEEMAARVAADMRSLDASLDLLDEAVATTLGISRGDLRAMEVVSRLRGATAGRLATELHLTTGAVTGLVDRMEAAGLFERNGDPRDRRKVVVQLTAKARERERRAYEPLMKGSIELYQLYGAEQLTVISDFLRRAQAAVDDARTLVQDSARRTGRRRAGRRAATESAAR